MSYDVTELWRRAADITWGNGTCVKGLTTSRNDCIVKETVKFSSDVKSQVPVIKGPGSLEYYLG